MSLTFGDAPLKRIAFTYKGTSLTLKINPQDYSYSRPQRASIYKTQNTNVIQQYGPDIATITIQGNTGWHRDGSGLTGGERFDQIISMFQEYQNDTQNGETPLDDMQLLNYTDAKYYTVTVAKDGFSYSRSVDNPLLFNYVIVVAVLKGTGQPNPSEKVEAQTGTGAGTSIRKATATNTDTNSYYAAIQTLEDSDKTQAARDAALNKLKELLGD